MEKEKIQKKLTANGIFSSRSEIEPEKIRGILSNNASALGEQIGIIIEKRITSCLEPVVEKYGFKLDKGGHIKSKRKGVKNYRKDYLGNEYEIDIEIEDIKHNPIILMESKFLRYKKHNRDKGSWICVAHHSLRKTYPSIRNTYAILLGSWSAPSIKLIESYGTKVYHITFEHIVEVLKRKNIIFDWVEKDREIPKKSWDIYNKLSDSEKDELAELIIAPIKETVIKDLESSLDSKRKKISIIKKISVSIEGTDGSTVYFESNTKEEAKKNIDMY